MNATGEFAVLQTRGWPLEPGVEVRARPHLFAVPAARAMASKPIRILIVDDDLVSTESLQLLLHGLGYIATRAAHSGRTALLQAAEFAPAVVLLDLNLPDMSSYQVAQLMRERAQVQQLRLIALTANRSHTARESARSAGFERYLLKPVEAVALDELLRMQQE